MDLVNSYQAQNNSNAVVDSSSSKSDLVQRIKTSLYKQERDRLWKVVKQVRNSTGKNKFFNNLVKIIQHELKADRVLVYRFEDENSGQAIAEAISPGWTPALNEAISCNCFGSLNALSFQTKGLVAIEDLNNAELTPYQKQLFDRYQVQASLALPILLNSVDSENGYELNQVWGLIVVQQCNYSRQWQEDEINLLYNLTLEATRILQSPSHYFQSDEEDLVSANKRSLQEMLLEIRKSLRRDKSTLKGTAESDDLLTQTHNGMASLRAWIYTFNPDGSGQVIVESTTEQLEPAGSVFDYDNTLTAENCKTEYVVNDIYNQDFPKCLIASFEAIAAKSYIAIPLKAGDRLLGILSVFQGSVRKWQQSEVELMHRYAARAIYSTQQISLVRNSQFQAQQLKAFASKDLVAAVSSQIEKTMEHKLEQIRAFTKADRVLVYGFNPDGSGEIIAESLDSMWKRASNSFDNDCFITPENCQSKYVANDIYEKEIAPCFIEQIESLEARAYIIIPIKSGDRLLGMLGIYQNSAPRNWQESDIRMAMEYAPKFSLPLEQTSNLRALKFKAKQAELISEQDFLISISQNSEAMMQSLLNKIRASMKIDRSVVFAFNPDWSGKIITESFGAKWQPAGSVLDYDFHFKGGEFEPYYVANNVQTKGLAGAVLEKFEEIEAKAYIIVPIHTNNQLMGLLAVYQNSAPRNWLKSEIEQLQEYAVRFAKPLQQTSFLRNAQFQNERMEKAFKREKSLAKVLEKVRLSKDEKAVWQIATDEGRKILDVERVSIYRFNPDWSGNFVADSAAPGWSDLTKIIPFIEDTFLQNTKGGRYKNGETFAVDDIYLQGHKQCHIELLEQMETRAYVLAPIFIADSNMFGSKKLWGLIGCYQNKGARRWQEYEVSTLRQLGLQVGVAMQQINYLTRLEKQTELENTSSKISEQIRKADNVDDIFKVTTQEVRQALKADRTIVYQFNPDWSGQVVAESVAIGWVSLLVEQTDDEVLSGNRTGSDRCILRKWSTDDIVENDTYLQKTQANKYFTGKRYTAVNDIYQKKFPDCYIKSLERYQAKAYIIAPIFQGDKLWGLLGVYQNSGTRDWQKMEADQMMQLANQLGIAIQQVDYYEKLRIQSANLTETLSREKSAREELQKQALDILKTVRPAFSGDLTVRAKVTETEIGTVAGAYNTTLDSLKGIVEQVQIAALQVTETTGSSSTAIKGLSVQSERQLEELQQALDRVQAMIDASTVTTENAQKVEIAIEQANQTVQNGDRAMNNTVDSIASIRETVADAGKRVKRLSDSSQKISKVVSLISSFATQTNLLALNAALEATRAGEYGKGFAVVADEVRNLSLQSTEATTEIEKLVREIQEETQEVSAAMSAGIEQVTEGTSLVNETRDSLNEIVSATAQIKELVEGITTAANAQTQEAASVTQVMGQVAQIANETSQDSGKISISFQELEQLAQNLQASVSQFKVK